MGPEERAFLENLLSLPLVQLRKKVDEAASEMFQRAQAAGAAAQGAQELPEEQGQPLMFEPGLSQRTLLGNMQKLLKGMHLTVECSLPA